MKVNLKEKLSERNLLKVITGINNFNIDKISQIVLAAELSKATYIDVAPSDFLVRVIRQKSQLPICISTLDPSNIYKCLCNGATLIEIGNYDTFYKQGIFFTVSKIFTIAKHIKNLFPDTIICVTIPHHLPIKKQVFLSQKLEAIGIDLLQTEGISSQKNLKTTISTTISQIAATLSATYAISKVVSIPIITASGISHITGPIAIKYGASGIGIGSAISKLKSVNEMVSFIEIINTKLTQDLYKEIEYEKGEYSPQSLSDIESNLLLNNIKINSL